MKIQLLQILNQLIITQKDINLDVNYPKFPKSIDLNLFEDSCQGDRCGSGKDLQSKYHRPFVKADYYSVDNNTNDRVTQYTLSKTGFDRHQFLRNNGQNTITPSTNDKMVTIYKNIMSNNDFSPYSLKTKRIGLDKGEDDPCKLNQDDKSNILSCELQTMLQKRLKAHDQGQKQIDVGDSYCNCDNLKKPCDALEKLQETKAKVTKEMKADSPGNTDPDDENKNKSTYNEIGNSNKYGQSNQFSDTTPSKTTADLDKLNKNKDRNDKSNVGGYFSDQFRKGNSQDWSKLWNSSFIQSSQKSNNNKSKITAKNSIQNIMKESEQNHKIFKNKAKINKFLNNSSKNLNKILKDKLKSWFQTKLSTKISTFNKQTSKKIQSLSNNEKVNMINNLKSTSAHPADSTNILKFLKHIEDPLNQAASIQEVTKAEFKLQCCCTMQTYTLLGKNSIPNYNHQYRNGLGAGNLIKNLTNQHLYTVLSHNQIINVPACEGAVPDSHSHTTVDSCFDPKKQKDLMRQLFNQSFDKLMESYQVLPEDKRREETRTKDKLPYESEDEDLPLHSFRGLDFSRFDSDIVYSSVNKPLLVLNQIKNHGDLMKSQRRLQNMSDEEFDRIQEQDRELYPVAIKDEEGVRIIWKFKKNKFDEQVKIQGKKWTNLKERIKNNQDVFLNDMGGYDDNDTMRKSNKLK